MSKTHSVGITKENYELLKQGAALKGTSMQSLVNNLIRDIGIADKTEKVILCVPSSLTKRNKEGLREWLQSRLNAVLAAYYPENREVTHAAYFEADRGQVSLG